MGLFTLLVIAIVIYIIVKKKRRKVEDETILNSQEHENLNTLFTDLEHYSGFVGVRFLFPKERTDFPKVKLIFLDDFLTNYIKERQAEHDAYNLEDYIHLRPFSSYAPKVCGELEKVPVCDFEYDAQLEHYTLEISEGLTLISDHPSALAREALQLAKQSSRVMNKSDLKLVETENAYLLTAILNKE